MERTNTALAAYNDSVRDQVAAYQGLRSDFLTLQGPRVAPNPVCTAMLTSGAGINPLAALFGPSLPPVGGAASIPEHAPVSVVAGSASAPVPTSRGGVLPTAHDGGLKKYHLSTKYHFDGT